jgi:hypothetical protein
LKIERPHIHAPQYGIRLGKQLAGLTAEVAYPLPEPQTAFIKRQPSFANAATERPRFHYPKDLDIPGREGTKPQPALRDTGKKTDVPVIVRKRRHVLRPTD